MSTQTIEASSQKPLRIYSGIASFPENILGLSDPGVMERPIRLYFADLNLPDWRVAPKIIVASIVGFAAWPSASGHVMCYVSVAYGPEDNTRRAGLDFIISKGPVPAGLADVNVSWLIFD